jgi:hypothetical protein
MAAIVLKMAFIAALFLWTGGEANMTPNLACDGNPPKLINKDTQAYDYVISCGSNKEKSSIGPNSNKKFTGKSGCTLKVGNNAPTKLFTEMICTVSGGKLTCDLL